MKWNDKDGEYVEYEYSGEPEFYNAEEFLDNLLVRENVNK